MLDWIWFGLLGLNASATARVRSRFGLVYWGLTPQQQPGSYQGGEMMMMKSVFWWRKPEYPEETTDLRQVTDETFHTYGLCPVRGLNLGRSGVKQSELRHNEPMANAWIAPPPFGKSCIRPWGKNRQAKKKKQKKKKVFSTKK